MLDAAPLDPSPSSPSDPSESGRPSGGRSKRATRPAATPEPAATASDAEVDAEPTLDADDASAELEGGLELEDQPNPELAQGPVPSEATLLEALKEAFKEESTSPALLARYAQHAKLVLEGNRRLNLTAIVEPRDVAVKHYLDCWRATRLLPLIGKSVLDLGTGGGFPGMPVALGEERARVVLLDSRAKRVAFVQETIDALGVKNATAVCDRGEDHLARHTYDVVFMRALSSVRENVRTLRKVRHRFTDLVMFKGPSWSREVRAAERESERLGFRLDTVWEYELPAGMGQRALLVYRAPGGR